MSIQKCIDGRDSALARFATLVGCEWEHIDSAQKKTLKITEQLSSIVDGIANSSGTGSDASIIVHGSVARQECTSASDLDWTLLVDAQADTGHHDLFLEIKKSLSAADEKAFHYLFGLKPPGKEGTFGSLVFSQPLIHCIGGEEDTNSNTTRRILLLLEALPIGSQSAAFGRVRKSILKRYLVEDRGLLKHDLAGKDMRWVPLFMLNDFARYWRTMAVDFAYKQFDRGSKGYALRSIKLGISRKLLYASGLLACFWCDPKISMDHEQATTVFALTDSLDRFFSLTPLERIARFFVTHCNDASSHLANTGRELFTAYDEFLALLDDKGKREHLDKLPPCDEEKDSVFKEARGIRQKFRKAVGEMFLDKDSPLYEFSIAKGVF